MAQLLSLRAQHRDEGWWLLAVQSLPGRHMAPPTPSKQQLPGCQAPIPSPGKKGAPQRVCSGAGLGEAFNVCGKGEILQPDQFEHLHCERAQGTGVPTA